MTSPVTKVIEFWQAAGFRIERGGQEMNYFWARSEITPTWLVQNNSWSRTCLGDEHKLYQKAIQWSKCSFQIQQRVWNHDERELFKKNLLNRTGIHNFFTFALGAFVCTVDSFMIVRAVALKCSAASVHLYCRTWCLFGLSFVNQ